MGKLARGVNGNDAITGGREGKGKERFPGVEDEDFKIGAQGFPAMAFTAKFLPAVLVEGVRQREDLMTREGEEGEDDHGEAFYRTVELSMPEIMLQVVALIL